MSSRRGSRRRPPQGTSTSSWPSTPTDWSKHPRTGFETALTDLATVLSKVIGPLDDIADTLLACARPAGERADDTALLGARRQRDVGVQAGVAQQGRAVTSSGQLGAVVDQIDVPVH
jgi:hypothetical protein